MEQNGNGSKDIRLIITLSPEGIVNVEGPLENKIFCLGLIELAKDAIYKFKPLLHPNKL